MAGYGLPALGGCGSGEEVVGLAGEANPALSGWSPVGAALWEREGGQLGDGFGSAVAGVGDVDGDGYDDVMVGAPGYPGGSGLPGRAVLFTGGPDGPSAEPVWSMLETTSSAVAGAGDVNGDGYADFLTSATPRACRAGPRGRCPTGGWGTTSCRSRARAT